MENKFLYYYTLGEEFQSQFKYSLAGLIKGVSISKIKNFLITIPSFEEQKRIVTKLDTIFSEVSTINELLEQKMENYQALRSLILSQELQSEAV